MASEPSGRGGGVLRCPVRGCGALLEREAYGLSCPAGHSFDRARSGYFNLLQPQDRRARSPGDAREVALARRRFLEAGHEEPFVCAVLEDPAVCGLPSGAAVLDIGCGEGFYLRRLAAERPVEAYGLDLSAAAVDLAARAHPPGTWVVANADRSLPYTDGAFALAWSLTARQNAAELCRVLAPGAQLLVAVPGEDDLLELREAALGEGVRRDRTERTVATFAPFFEPVERRTVRWSLTLDAQALADALAATYRGGRPGRLERAARLAGLPVIASRELLRFRPAPR